MLVLSVFEGLWHSITGLGWFQVVFITSWMVQLTPLVQASYALDGFLPLHETAYVAGVLMGTLVGAGFVRFVIKHLPLFGG